MVAAAVSIFILSSIAKGVVNTFSGCTHLDVSYRILVNFCERASAESNRGKLERSHQAPTHPPFYESFRRAGNHIARN